MATRMIRMTKIREILQLYNAGFSTRSIARTTGKSRTAVANAIQKSTDAGITWDKVQQLDDKALQEIVYPASKCADDSRFETLSKLIPEILKNLSKKHMTLDVQWENYKAIHPDGYGYSRFCDHIRQATKPKDVFCGMQYTYGEQLLIDFAGNGHHYYLDLSLKEKKEVQLFVGVLPASQYTFAEFKPAQKTEDWIGGTQSAIRFFGGCTKSFTPDCAKAVVTKADKFDSEIQVQFRQFAEYHGSVVTPARPGRPRDKALVENSINNIYRWVYPRLARQEYFSLAELNEALRVLMVSYNARVMKLYRCSRLDLFKAHEEGTLSALPEKPYEFKHYQAPMKPAFNGHLWLKADRHYYSVPERFIGRLCSVFYTSTSVEIFCDHVRIASHLRCPDDDGKYTTLREHLPAASASFMDWNPEQFRTWAKSYGANVEELTLKLMGFARHYTHCYRLCMGLLRLGKLYPADRFDRACEMVLSVGSMDIKRVKSILEKGTDTINIQQLPLPDLPTSNPNIRHYQLKEHIA